MSEGSKPAMKFRIGNVSATIWRNNERFFTTVLSRAYKEGEEWRQTDQLSSADLLNGSALLQRCELWISGQPL